VWLLRRHISGELGKEEEAAFMPGMSACPTHRTSCATSIEQVAAPKAVFVVATCTLGSELHTYSLPNVNITRKASIYVRGVGCGGFGGMN
jgi:hypothetical protein